MVQTARAGAGRGAVRFLYRLFLSGLIAAAVGHAAAQPLDPAALEREARRIETMLIAPCCWTQPVSLHQSRESDDVKREIRVLLAAGKAPEQVVDAFVSKYGQQILVEPRPRGFGLVLYAGLALGFVLTGTMLVVWIRNASRRSGVVEAAAPTGDSSDDVYAARLDDELRDMD